MTWLWVQCNPVYSRMMRCHINQWLNVTFSSGSGSLQCLYLFTSLLTVDFFCLMKNGCSRTSWLLHSHQISVLTFDTSVYTFHKTFFGVMLHVSVFPVRSVSALDDVSETSGVTASSGQFVSGWIRTLQISKDALACNKKVLGSTWRWKGENR